MNADLYEKVEKFTNSLSRFADEGPELVAVRNALAKATPREQLEATEKILQTRLYGMDEQIRVAMLATAGGLRILFVGSPATGKNHLFYRFSEIFGLKYRIVTKNEVATKTSIFAKFNIKSTKEEGQPDYLPGPALLADAIQLDEISLWPAQVKGEVHSFIEDGEFMGMEAKAKFVWLAQNPEVQELYGGTYEEMNIATKSRMEVVVPFKQPDAFASQLMVEKFAATGRREPALSQVLSWETMITARREIGEVKVDGMAKVWLALLGLELTVCKKLDEEGYEEDKISIPRSMLNRLCERCELKASKVSGVGKENISICSRFSAPMGRVNRATTVLAQSFAWFDGRKLATSSDMARAVKYTLLAVLVDNAGEYITSRQVGEVLGAFNENQGRRQMNRKELGGEAPLGVLKKWIDEVNQNHTIGDTDKLLKEFEGDYAFQKYMMSIIDHLYDKALKFWTNMVDSATEADAGTLEDRLANSGLKPLDLQALRDTLKIKVSGDSVEFKFDGSQDAYTKALTATVAVLRSVGDQTTTPTVVLTALKAGKFKHPSIDVEIVTDKIMVKARTKELARMWGAAMVK